VNDSLTYDYDPANRLTVVTQNGLILPGTPDIPVATTYVWDDASERVRVTQPMSSTQNLVRNWTYDTSGRLASYADAKGTTTYSYGAANQLESVADPRNLTLKFEYDNLSRRTRRYALSGGNTVDGQTFTNDLAGNMLAAKVVASGTTITMDYDNDARPSHVYQASYPTPTTTYSYSPSTGRLASIVDPAGTTTYDYNANGQLFHLTDPFNSSSQVTYGYDSAGRVSSRTDPAGLTWTRTYESGTGRLDTQTIVKAATTLGSFNLGYDQASNVTTRLETVKTETGPDNADSGTWTYGYDAANRMTSSTAPAPSNTVTAYAYDGAGNRTSVKVGTANPVITTYDAAGLPTSSSDNTSYTHDAIGELTKIDKPGGTANDWNLVYSSWGVLKTAAHKTTGTPDVAYTSDALDRVLSRVAGSTTAYTYRGTGEDAAKAQVGAATPVFYAFSPGGPLARRTGTDAATLRYFVKDLHGDVVGLAATTGTNPMKGTILYSPWGVPGTKTGELATFPAQGHLRFQGQLTDALTGQVDMLTRNYEPTMGRFDTRDVLFGDPTDPTSLNLSVYAQDAPVTFTDPTGMMLLGGGGGGPCHRACRGVQQAQIDAQSNPQACGACSPAVVEPRPPRNLSLKQFEQISERQRIRWLDRFADYYQLEDWFEGIRGVLMAGRATSFMDPGTWSSWVDAGILHGIQEGMSIYKGRIEESRNPGAMRWGQFFAAFYRESDSATIGRADVAQLKSLWAASETESTAFGRSLAEHRGLHPNGGEEAVYEWASLWRNTVRWGGTPLTPESVLAGLWDVASPDFELFDPRVPSPITMNLTMSIYLAGL